MTSLLLTPIAYLKGVGPQKAETLQQELGIFTFEDLLYHFPYRYQDRSTFHEIMSNSRAALPTLLKLGITEIRNFMAVLRTAAVILI
jgi:RecG-like helicase